MLSRPSRRKAIPFERLRCRRQLVGRRPEPVSRDLTADLRKRRPDHGDDAQRRAPSDLHQRPGGDSRGHGGFVCDRLFPLLLLSHAYEDKHGEEAEIRILRMRPRTGLKGAVRCVARRCDFLTRGGLSPRSWRLRREVDRHGNTCKDCGDEIDGHCGGGSRAELLSVRRGGVLWHGGSWRNAISG